MPRLVTWRLYHARRALACGLSALPREPARARSWCRRARPRSRAPARAGCAPRRPPASPSAPGPRPASRPAPIGSPSLSFGRDHRRVVAEHALDRLRLGLVGQPQARWRCPHGLDVAAAPRPRAPARRAWRARRPRPRGRSARRPGVGGDPVAEHLAVDARAARLGLAEPLERRARCPPRRARSRRRLRARGQHAEVAVGVDDGVGQRVGAPGRPPRRPGRWPRGRTP